MRPSKKVNLSNTDVAKNRKKADQTKDGLHKLMKSSRWTFFGGIGERKPNLMSNADRRKAGLEQDPDLPDYQQEFPEGLFDHKARDGEDEKSKENSN